MSAPPFNTARGKEVLAQFIALGTELGALTKEMSLAQESAAGADESVTEIIRASLEASLSSEASPQATAAQGVSGLQTEVDEHAAAATSANATSSSGTAEGVDDDATVEDAEGDDEEEGDEEDEWDDDEDIGYVLVAITEDEFFEMEEEANTALSASASLRKDAKAWAGKGEGEGDNAEDGDGDDDEDDEEAVDDDAVTEEDEEDEADENDDTGDDDDLLESDLAFAEAALSNDGAATTDAKTEANTEANAGLKNVKRGSIVGSGKALNGAFGIPLGSSVASSGTGAARRPSLGQQRRAEIMGQNRYKGIVGRDEDGTLIEGPEHCYFNLKVIFEPNRTGFEESKTFNPPPGTVIAGRYQVLDVLGTAAFSTALQCHDLAAEEDEQPYVCLKCVKNSKDFFDQSMDEIKLLQYINSRGDPDEKKVLRLIDFFYYKEHLFIVSELLRENLYEFGRSLREDGQPTYFVMPRLKLIMKQVLEALEFIHSLKLIHCDIKPENIVMKSYSRCLVKLIDFGSSCYTTDQMMTYIQSRSYRAPEVILGHKYDARIDIWSMGGVLAELHTGYVLFQNFSIATMLARITGIMGPFPPHVLLRGKESVKYFTLSNVVYERSEQGEMCLIYPKKTSLAHRLHMDPQSRARHAAEALAALPDTPPGYPPVTDAEAELFVDFVGQMLNLDPSKRLTASQLLAHEWLKDCDRFDLMALNKEEDRWGSGGTAPPLNTDGEEEEGEEGDDDDDGNGEGEDQGGAGGET